MLTAEVRSKTVEDAAETWTRIVLERHRDKLGSPDKQSKMRERQWRCPHCTEKVLAVMGTLRIWHFRHAASERRECALERLGPETDRHRQLKFILAQGLEVMMGQGSVADFEVRLPEIGRVADVLCRLPAGEGEEGSSPAPSLEGALVGEVQLSTLTLEDLRKRSEAYESLGLEPVWLFLEGEVARGGRFHPHLEWLQEQGHRVMLARMETVTQTLELPEVQRAEPAGSR